MASCSITITDLANDGFMSYDFSKVKTIGTNVNTLIASAHYKLELILETFSIGKVGSYFGCVVPKSTTVDEHLLPLTSEPGITEGASS